MKATNVCLLLVLFAVQFACSGGSSKTPPKIADTAPIEAVTTREFTTTLNASLGRPPYTWATESLIPGLELSPAGVLSGIPTETGEYSLAVSVTDQRGLAATTTVTVTVVDPEFAIASYQFLRRLASEADDNLQSETSVRFVTETELPFDGEIVEYDDEGNVESRQSISYEHDSTGNLTKLIRMDEDATLASSTDFLYDNAGNLLEKRQDWNGDGVVDRYTHTVFDGNGDATQSYIETLQAGTYVRNNVATYVYGAPTRWLTRDIDYNADGRNDFHDEWQYDPLDLDREIHVDEDSLNAAREPFSTPGGGPDGTFDREMWITWTDNPDGTVTRYLERDLDRDGDVDRTDLRIILNGGRYSPPERQSFSTLYEQDLNADGTPEVRHVREFNEQDQVTLFRYEQASNSYVREETISYDLSGKPLLRIVTSSSNRPETDSVSTYTAEYDDWTIGNANVPEFYFFDET
ncbi:MAG: putative Ig domain-containing protein [Pseudomonadales bacterium]